MVESPFGLATRREGQHLTGIHRGIADRSAREVVEFCKLTPRGKQVLETAMRQLHLSARAYHRFIKVARTIADLDHADRIDTPHVAEALQYRQREGD